MQPLVLRVTLPLVTLTPVEGEPDAEKNQAAQEQLVTDIGEDPDPNPNPKPKLDATPDVALALSSEPAP